MTFVQIYALVALRLAGRSVMRPHQIRSVFSHDVLWLKTVLWTEILLVLFVCKKVLPPHAMVTTPETYRARGRSLPEAIRHNTVEIRHIQLLEFSVIPLAGIFKKKHSANTDTNFTVEKCTPTRGSSAYAGDFLQLPSQVMLKRHFCTPVQHYTVVRTGFEAPVVLQLSPVLSLIREE